MIQESKGSEIKYQDKEIENEFDVENEKEANERLDNEKDSKQNTEVSNGIIDAEKNNEGNRKEEKSDEIEKQQENRLENATKNQIGAIFNTHEYNERHGDSQGGQTSETKIQSGGIEEEKPSEEAREHISSSTFSPSSVNIHPPLIERQHVHQVYDLIAGHFSATRFAKWPRVAEFLSNLTPGSLILDAGCGNGKYLSMNPSCIFIGCDTSIPLLKICANNGAEVAACDTLCLPFRPGSFDAAISIAVLHHLSSVERRCLAISQLLEAVKVGGHVLITVWAVEQENQSLVAKWTPLSGRFTESWSQQSKLQSASKPPNLVQIDEEETPTLESVNVDESELKDGNVAEKEKVVASIKDENVEDKVHTRDDDIENEGGSIQQEYLVPWHLPFHRADIQFHQTPSPVLESGLVKLDEKKKAVVYNRYYHVFEEGEIIKYAKMVGGCDIVDHFYDKSNWCIILKKTS